MPHILKKKSGWYVYNSTIDKTGHATHTRIGPFSKVDAMVTKKNLKQGKA